jgi:small-conductance mechanosensitive channel
MKRWMTTRQWLVSGILLSLVVLAVVGLILTGDTDSQARQSARRAPLVSERPLQTARSLAPSASTREERRYAQQALKLADHEVDLAFADALQQAAGQPAQLSAEAKQAQAAITRLEALLKADQNSVAQLTSQAASSNPALHDEGEQKLPLAQAQLELDKDELDDARQHLRRSGSDRLSRIRRQFDRHQAGHDDPVPAPASDANGAVPEAHLIASVRTWYDLQGRISQISAAGDEARALSTQLEQEHDSGAAQLAHAQGPALTEPSAQTVTGDAVVPNNASPQLPVESLRQLANTQKHLLSLSQRSQDAQELADAYNNWTTSLGARQKQALHNVLRCALWILLIFLALYLALRGIDHFTFSGTIERMRLHTLRTILHVATKGLAVVVVLLIVFGTPSQMTTILGLAGAGLTIVMKDFIVAFFGWFVLMGRNGIRVGDWVEINGVLGEVVEINLLRTVLLESGNRTDTGHPTGRKVAFMNGYAIEGHFFNFSTTGQWLWDDLQITIPDGENPYPLIDTIQRLVTQETAINSKLAEQEWKSASGRYRSVQAVSASPAVFIRPAGSDIEVHVRYVTKASERYATRSRLYAALVELLHHKELPEPEHRVLADA